jgi:hypothetical protein
MSTGGWKIEGCTVKDDRLPYAARFYLKYRDKVERISTCTACDGKGGRHINPGKQTLRFEGGETVEFFTGSYEICPWCVCGEIVTYPWTRGRSLPPLVRRSA